MGHAGNHSPFPNDAWDFFNEKDKKKLVKAGFATPRGGAKGAYQNHVARSSKVIIPFERIADTDLELYRDGYVIRVLPDQYFSGPMTPKPEFLSPDARVKVGENAFVLYRTHDSFRRLPPIANWSVRALLKNGQPVTRRGDDVVDTGHYSFMRNLGSSFLVSYGWT
ncbi:BstXI family restriction endonuclease, partial [bacterium]|nr:BstXI family restriction endonuclease [bacterium]